MDYTKRYWLFIYDHYYPSGGLNDLHGTYNTIEECKVVEAEHGFKRDYYRVYDTQDNMKLVWSKNNF